jgi:hypothetical protein
MGTLGWITIGMIVVFVIAYFSMGEPPRDSTVRDYQKDGGKLHRAPPPAPPSNDES